MALALYRKYRPASFAELIGQEHVANPLRTALEAGRINHAYLFSGPRGCGKTSSARILARSLNCAAGPTGDPCGECESCAELAPEGAGSVDVIELDAASHGGVDDTRELRDRAFFSPARSRYRIFIIDEAHMVTNQGFNALLKIVEEPPEHLIFIFATTEPDKVLTTIRSRTHHYPFRLLPPSVMRELLERVCAAEEVKIEPAVFPLVIRAGGGSARDSLSVLDQLLAGAGEDGITYPQAVSLLGVTDIGLINDMVDALAAEDSATVYSTVDHLVEAGHDPRRFAADLLDRLRDLILLASVPDAAERGLLDATGSAGDDLSTLQSQADRLGLGTLNRYAEILHEGLAEMRGATAPRLLLELLCSRMLLPAVSTAESALLQRLERLEKRSTLPTAGSVSEASAVAAAAAHNAVGRDEERGSGQPAGKPEPAAAPEPVQRAHPAPAPAQPVRPQAPVEPQPAKPEPVQAQVGGNSAGPSADSQEQSKQSGMDVAQIRRVWTEVLQEVASLNRPTQALLLNATVQGISEGALELAMPTAPLAKQFDQPHRVDFVKKALASVLGGEWDVRCVTAGAAQTQNPPQTPPRTPSEPPRVARAERPAPSTPERARVAESAARAEEPPPPEPPDLPEPPEPPEEMPPGPAAEMSEPPPPEPPEPELVEASSRVRPGDETAAKPAKGEPDSRPGGVSTTDTEPVAPVQEPAAEKPMAASTPDTSTVEDREQATIDLLVKHLDARPVE